MGMDLYGQHPSFEALRPQEPIETYDSNSPTWVEYHNKMADFRELPGVYYRSNMWWWRPIVMFLEENADDILDKDDINGLSHNSGYLIDAVKAALLSDRLKLAIQEGYVAAWVAKYKDMQDNAEPEPCWNCDAVGFTNGDPCRICDTKGTVPNFITNYPTNEEVFESFEDFVHHSGGFEVW